ncbi:MAG: FtsW/RodA/SpoVE family cell cycle protein [Clostridia bacterium]|nr:FtsW/RodA/SpoVE family cell cycle protein [Clostridia bacterium]
MSLKSKDKKISLLTRGSSDYIIYIVVLLLLSMGLIMVLSASSPSSLSESGNSYKYFKRQAEATGIGLVLMYIVSKFDYRIYKKFKWIIYIACIVFLIFVGVVRNRSRWGKKMDYYCWF